MGVVVVVLAAGEGKRMKSALPKVLHPIGGRSLLGHALAAARGTEPDQVVVVVGHGRDQVRAHLEAIDPAVDTVVQEQQNGTGHAVRVALEAVPPADAQTVLVVCGDVPLLRAVTLTELLERHQAMRNAVTVLTAVVPDPTGYGRILRAPDGGLEAIVEQRDATPEQHKISEINSGVYAFDAAILRDALGRLSTDNSQGEEYLTDVVSIARSGGARVGASLAPDHREILGVNDRAQLAELGKALNDRVVDGWMRAGVTVVDPATAWIDVQVVLEADAHLEQNVQLRGSTTIAAGAVIGPNTTLIDTKVGACAYVLASNATNAVIGPDSTVGPYSYLRPGTVLGEHTKAGAFVEIKNSTVGTGSKIPHLSYVGDGDIGEYSNIGCAAVFVNYDGVAKHRTIVGNHAFVGCDSMLVAPLVLGDGSYVAAGSVVTKDVPPGALAVARGTQRNIDNWVMRARPGSKAATAAEAAKRAAAGEQE